MKPLEPSSRAAFARAERLDAGGFQIVDDAGAQRHLGPDHDEVDLARLAERDHRRVVGEIERHAFGLARDAGIAGRAIELVGERARAIFQASACSRPPEPRIRMFMRAAHAG